MKKILLSIVTAASFLAPAVVKAQSFKVASDTVYGTVNGSANVNNFITDNTATPLTLKWRVIATNFPSDWLSGSAFGICDNKNCYNNDGDVVWSSATDMGGLYTSNPYRPDTAGPIQLALNFATVTPGTHWMNISISDPGTFYSKTITYVISKFPTKTPIVANDDATKLYPNPAQNEINVLFDANSDIKNIAVYSIIGKVMTVYKVSGNSANLNIENIPSGIYFVKLINSGGMAVSTRKFTKQ